MEPFAQIMQQKITERHVLATLKFKTAGHVTSGPSARLEPGLDGGLGKRPIRHGQRASNAALSSARRPGSNTAIPCAAPAIRAKPSNRAAARDWPNLARHRQAIGAGIAQAASDPVPIEIERIFEEKRPFRRHRRESPDPNNIELPIRLKMAGKAFLGRGAVAARSGGGLGQLG